MTILKGGEGEEEEWKENVWEAKRERGLRFALFLYFFRISGMMVLKGEEGKEEEWKRECVRGEEWGIATFSSSLFLVASGMIMLKGEEDGGQGPKERLC